MITYRLKLAIETSKYASKFFDECHNIFKSFMNKQEKVIAEWKPIECNYSDGGPDHNTKHNSVKLAQTAHFLKEDLDMSANAITYAGDNHIH